MLSFILLALFSGFGFLLRLCFAATPGSDDWAARRFIQEQSKGRWISNVLSDSLVPGTRGYPFLQHFIVSRFPRSSWVLVGRMLNASYDIATGIVVYFGAHTVLGYASIKTVSGIPLDLAATLLFLTTPILLPVTARLRATNARPLGLLLTTAYLIALGLSLKENSFWIALLSITPCLLIILSSQFAMQVMVFFSVVISLLLLTLTPIVIVIVALALAYGIPQLRARATLSHMIHHKIWYSRNAAKGTTASGRNLWRELLLLPTYLFSNLSKFGDLIFHKITPIIALYSAPCAFVVAAQILYSSGYNVAPAELNFLHAINFAGLIVFALTSLPKLSFLGQAERYLEYSAPAAAILFVMLLGNMNEADASFLFWLVLSVHLIGVMANLIWVNVDQIFSRRIEGEAALVDVLDHILSKNATANIATVPCKLSYAAGAIVDAAHNDWGAARFYYQFVLRENERGYESFEADMGGLLDVGNGRWHESFQVFGLLPSELNKKYGISHMIVDKQFLPGLKETWKAEGNVISQPLYQNSAYLVCSLNPPGPQV